MKKYLSIILLFVGSFHLFGQERNDSLVVLGTKLTFKMTDYWKYMNQEHSDASYCLLYNQVNFPNAANNNWLREKWSFSVRMRVTVFPFILDADGTKSKLNVNTVFSIPVYNSNKYYLNQDGFTVSLSVCPLPYINKFSEMIVPYLGYGYQWSQLSIVDKMDKKDALHPYSKMNLSSWVWKAGITIYLDKLPFGIMLEYKRTMNQDKIKNSDFLSIGVSFDLFKTDDFKMEKKPQIYIH
jgi:hypothetical protein